MLITNLKIAGPSRRSLLRASGVGLAGLAIGTSEIASAQVASIDKGGVKGGEVSFDPISDPKTEAPQKPADPPLAPSERVGVAIVGLGRLTLEEIIPAFSQARRVRIAGLVSGSQEKLATVGDQLGVAPNARYSYDQFERLIDNQEIKAVYVVLPNALHKEFVIRAAKIGKHVLCEKPMATSSAEAREMIAACETAKIRLMIAYRCQYEKANRKLAELARSEQLGELKLVEAVNAQNQGHPGQWRLKKALSGGGSLPDIGLYCLNTIRALTGEEPIEIDAQIWSTPNDPRFAEVEEAVTWLMRFPSGLHATCSTSYGVHKSQAMIAHTPAASLILENAFAYRGQRLRISQRDGEIESERTLMVKPDNQFTLELDHFGQCVLEGRRPRTPGEEGLQDHLLMEAIYRSAQTRTAVRFDPIMSRDAFRGPVVRD